VTDAEMSSVLKTCPHCGGLVFVLPTPGGQGQMAVCSQCRQEVGTFDKDGGPEAVIAGEVPAEPGMRLKHLLTASTGGERQPSPDRSSGEPSGEAPRPTAQENAPKSQPVRADIKQDLEASLRHQGFVVDDDGQNIRLRAVTGAGRGPGLGPSDIVRLAAELDGGIPPPEKRVHCPKCDAVIPSGHSKCQWCGTTLSQAG